MICWMNSCAFSLTIPSSVSHIGLLDAPWGPAISSLFTHPLILARNRIAKVPKRLEDTLGVGRHFDDQRHAKQFFSEPANINEKMENIVRSLLPPFVP